MWRLCRAMRSKMIIHYYLRRSEATKNVMFLDHSIFGGAMGLTYEGHKHSEPSLFNCLHMWKL